MLIRYCTYLVLQKEIVRESRVFGSLNDGLFEHFLINKVVKTSKYVKLKISNYHSELMGTCSVERAIVCIHT